MIAGAVLILIAKALNEFSGVRNVVGRPGSIDKQQKRLFDTALEMSLAATQDFEVMSSLRLTATEDHQETKRAFTEKRPPRFKGG